ncbi:hypothetical protein BaRGS_00037565 [Batillaria attramentaria]|uniref:Stc1 domain-containing protein n=1 Tax=Batillaria attramentaria TaxID=370345 RepID=A0ABD0J8J0_9CAEN
MTMAAPVSQSQVFRRQRSSTDFQFLDDDPFFSSTGTGSSSDRPARANKQSKLTVIPPNEASKSCDAPKKKSRQGKRASYRLFFKPRLGEMFVVEYFHASRSKPRDQNQDGRARRNAAGTELGVSRDCLGSSMEISPAASGRGSSQKPHEVQTSEHRSGKNPGILNHRPPFDHRDVEIVSQAADERYNEQPFCSQCFCKECNGQSRENHSLFVSTEETNLIQGRHVNNPRAPDNAVRNSRFPYTDSCELINGTLNLQLHQPFSEVRHSYRRKRASDGVVPTAGENSKQFVCFCCSETVSVAFKMASCKGKNPTWRGGYICEDCLYCVKNHRDYKY